MLQKIIVLLALVAGSSWSIETSVNWNGYLDTIQMPPCSSTVLIYSKKSLSLTDFDMIRIIAQAKDSTNHTNFASDSVAFVWGYQTFSLCLDIPTDTSTLDTCWSPPVLVDTFRTNLYGKMTQLSLDVNAIAASPTKSIDTTGPTGYATQSRTFAPEWDTFYRIWVRGLTGNKATKRIRLMFTNVRRLYRGSRGK